MKIVTANVLDPTHLELSRRIPAKKGDLIEISIRKRSRRKIFLLGAGASMATLGKDNAPLSKGFGKVLVSIPRWRARWPFLHNAL